METMALSRRILIRTCGEYGSRNRKERQFFVGSNEKIVDDNRVDNAFDIELLRRRRRRRRTRGERKKRRR